MILTPQAYDASLKGPHYWGIRTALECKAYFTDLSAFADTIPLDLAQSLKVRNHSPAGWEWGYGGSGPAQLALAILLHATQDTGIAQALHQRFKFSVVARFPVDSWQMSGFAVMHWVDRIRATERRLDDD